MGEFIIHKGKKTCDDSTGSDRGKMGVLVGGEWSAE